MKRFAAIAGACVAIAVVCIAVFATRPSPQQAISDAAVPSVPVTIVETGAIARTVVGVGRFGSQAGGTAKLAFASAGMLAGVTVVAGARVAAGQTLATLDRRTLAAARDQARADAAAADAIFAGGATAGFAEASARAKVAATSERLDTLRTGGLAALGDRIGAVAAARQTQIKIETDRAALARAATLYAGGVIAEKDVEAARAALAGDRADARAADARVAASSAAYREALRAAEADVAQARSDLAVARTGRGAAAAQRAAAYGRLASAEADYDRGAIVAPSDGRIASVLKHPGEAVDATTPVVEFVPPLGGTVTLAIPGIDATTVRAGDPATLALPGGARDEATVVAVVPVVDAITQTAAVVLRARHADVVAGTTVTATIVAGRARGVLVPASAVVTDPGTGRPVVFVRVSATKPATFVSRPVTVLAADAASAVVSGIRAGDAIARSGAYDLLAPTGG